MKDTAGNDIKIPQIRIITCNVIQTHLFTSAIIKGTLDYVDTRSNQLTKTDPVTAESIFEHYSAVTAGDLNALKPETRHLLGTTLMPFPSDMEMIMNAGITIKI